MHHIIYQFAYAAGYLDEDGCFYLGTFIQKPKNITVLTNKKAVCEKLVEFQNTILPNGGDRHSKLFHTLFTKNRVLRDTIVAEVHELNAKG